MTNFIKRLNIGTCSWKYDSWKGLIYSDKKNIPYLLEYAKNFKIVEVDQWFWSLFGDQVVLPKSEVVLEYASQVPDDFKFSIKVPNALTLTHHYSKGKKGPLKPNSHFLRVKLFEEFISLLRPIQKQIDSFIFQFEYLKKQKISGQGEFLNRLKRFFTACPDSFRYGVETRNQNYLNADYFIALRQMGTAHVFLQGYWMPPIYELYKKYGQFIEKFSVIRLLGPDRQKIESLTQKKWDRILIPRDNELQQIHDMVCSLMDRGLHVTLSVNNHYEGSAPETIRRFLDLLKQK